MHNETTKALYEFYKLEDKNDFFPAYLYLKYIQHFIYHVVKSLDIEVLKEQQKKGSPRAL